MDWSTSCLDWEDRIIAGKSLLPGPPLFPDQAEKGLEILKGLRIVDAPGSPTFGEACLPWAFDLPTALFGAYDEESGRRLIREFFLLISKKNIKSTLAAGIMLTALLLNWRLSNEFLVLAPTMEIANNTFGPAKDAVYADEELADLLHVQEHLRLITHRLTKAKLKVVAADSEAVSGKKAAGILIEEVWLFGKRANAANMLREATGGLLSRPEGFVISISTQSDEAPAGVFRQKLDYFRAVRDGKISDKRSLPLIYEFPERVLKEGAHLNPKNFFMTNPNLGKSVDPEFLVDKFKEAEIASETDPGAMPGFLAKHLNVEIETTLTVKGWAGAPHWSRGVGPGLTLETILERCEVVTCGIDGGGLDDLFGFAAVGREIGTRRWLAWVHALIGPEGLERRKANEPRYRDFEAAGDLTIVERLPEDLEWLQATVGLILDSGKLGMVGADPAGIGGAVDALADIGVTEEAGLLTGVSQGIKLMGAGKTLERKIVDGSLVHSGSPLMAWCVGNVRVRQTSTAVLVERAASGYGKIDPFMALLDAAHLMGLNPQPKRKRSIYEERGLQLV